MDSFSCSSVKQNEINFFSRGLPNYLQLKQSISSDEFIVKHIKLAVVCENKDLKFSKRTDSDILFFGLALWWHPVEEMNKSK